MEVDEPSTAAAVEAAAAEEPMDSEEPMESDQPEQHTIYVNNLPEKLKVEGAHTDLPH